MKILALVKCSLDVSEVKVDAATSALRLAGVPEKIGNIDKNVVEAAMRLKEAAGGTVHVVSLAPVRTRDLFRDVLAMGAEDLTLLDDPFDGKADAAVAVRVLEAAIRKLAPFDLVVSGFASDDGYSYQVAPRLAERLGLPLVAYARRLSVADDRLQAERDLGLYVQTVIAPLPAVVSVAEEAFQPRRTTLMEAIKAKKKPVNVWNVTTDLGLEQPALDAAATMVAATQTGVVVHRKQQVLKGAELPALADQLIDALVRENVLKGGV